jgi:hypothetical protein
MHKKGDSKKSKALDSNLINLTFKNKHINFFLANKISENSKNIIFNYVFLYFYKKKKDIERCLFCRAIPLIVRL